jgi:hypothetical protein
MQNNCKAICFIVICSANKAVGSFISEKVLLFGGLVPVCGPIFSNKLDEKKQLNLANPVLTTVCVPPMRTAQYGMEDIAW